MSRSFLGTLALVLVAAVSSAQDIPLEYRVKAAYLFNFTKFVEWPEGAIPAATPLTMCVAAPNPFGPALAEIVRGELVDGRPITTRVVRGASGCHVLFVPAGVNAVPYLLEARTKPILTVGESPDFLRDGGIVNFVTQDGKVRFQINHDAASQVHLRVSSRLLRLALSPETR